MRGTLVSYRAFLHFLVLGSLIVGGVTLRQANSESKTAKVCAATAPQPSSGTSGTKA